MNVNLKSLIAKLNDTSRAALEGAATLCVARTHYEIEVEHFLVKLLDAQDSDLKRIAQYFGVNQTRLLSELERSLDRLKNGNSRAPAFATNLVSGFTNAWQYGSLEQNAGKIRSGFVIVALLADESLARLVFEISREMLLVSAEVLRREFDAIVAGSAEDSATEPARVPPATSNPSVFIAYRREDGALYADYLHACFRAEVPNLRIFRESEILKPGVVSAEKINESVMACDVLLAIIGQKWLSANASGGATQNDWVQLEIATALKHNKLVIPCLVNGAAIPADSELPPELAGLATRQAVVLSETDLRRDTEALVQRFKNWKGVSQ